jgi:hypothetical protein
MVGFVRDTLAKRDGRLSIVRYSGMAKLWLRLTAKIERGKWHVMEPGG